MFQMTQKGMRVQGLSYSFRMNGLWLQWAGEFHTTVGEGEIARMFGSLDRRQLGHVHLTLEDGSQAWGTPDMLVNMWA